MKKLKYFFLINTFLLISGFSTFRYGEKDFSISIEVANGAACTVMLDYGYRRIDFGFGNSLDLKKKIYGDRSYQMIMYSVFFYPVFHFLIEKPVLFFTRLRIGQNVFSVVNIETYYYPEITPELIIGYKKFYLVSSLILMFALKPEIIPQIGFGARFTF